MVWRDDDGARHLECIRDRNFDIAGRSVLRLRGKRLRCTDHRKEEFNVLHGFHLFASARLSRSAICLSQSLASCRGRIQIEAEFNVKRSIKLLDAIARDDDVIKKDTDVSRGVVLSYVLEMFDVRLVRSRDGDRCAECGNPKLILSSRI